MPFDREIHQFFAYAPHQRCRWSFSIARLSKISCVHSFLAMTIRLWQKTALPTARQNPLNPRKQHRESRKTRFKHEIVPSMPA